MWWREHKQMTPIERRIQSWEHLKKALFKTFAPREHALAIRDKLRALKQTGTVLEYTAAFRQLTMQLPDLHFGEAEYLYLQGLDPRIKDLVRTRDNITDIRALQNACLRLDICEQEEEHGEKALIAKTSRNRRDSKFDGRCSFCNIYGHKEIDCRNKKGENNGYNIFRGKCKFCGIYGHQERECRKKGYNHRTGDNRANYAESSESEPVAFSAIVQEVGAESQDNTTVPRVGPAIVKKRGKDTETAPSTIKAAPTATDAAARINNSKGSVGNTRQRYKINRYWHRHDNSRVKYNKHNDHNERGYRTSRRNVTKHFSFLNGEHCGQHCEHFCI
jgi:Retrotransposon gag protein